MRLRWIYHSFSGRSRSTEPHTVSKTLPVSAPLLSLRATLVRFFQHCDFGPAGKLVRMCVFILGSYTAYSPTGNTFLPMTYNMFSNSQTPTCETQCSFPVIFIPVKSRSHKLSGYGRFWSGCCPAVYIADNSRTPKDINNLWGNGAAKASVSGSDSGNDCGSMAAAD